MLHLVGLLFNVTVNIIITWHWDAFD